MQVLSETVKCTFGYKLLSYKDINGIGLITITTVIGNYICYINAGEERKYFQFIAGGNK